METPGALRLPPGFRFHPTDEELVVQYLRRKALSCPLPASIIPEADIAKHNPWDLPGGCEQERYFFARREAKYPNGSRSNRASGCGHWKATGKDRPVVASRCRQVVGMKKVLVFYHGKAPNGTRTDWVMHEYSLAGPLFAHRRNNATATTNCGTAPLRDWVLCRIFMKKRATKVETEAGEPRQERQAIGFIDFMRLRGFEPLRRPSPPASSESSCVTDISDGASNCGEDISSSP